MADNDKPLLKPRGQSTSKVLSDMQFGALYGLSRSFVDGQTDVINNIISVSQEIISKTKPEVGGSTPQLLVASVKNNIDSKEAEMRRQNSSKNKYFTGLKGITDLDKDMDLYRELVPIATPMFELFYEYEMIISMLPEVARCESILKSCVLSPDTFTKKFLIPRYDDIKIQDSQNNGNTDKSKIDSVKVIDSIIDEYKINERVDLYIDEAMKYGCKPVMVVPIDDNFRDAAKDLLKVESSQDMSKMISDKYGDGVKVTTESLLPSSNNMEDVSKYESNFTELIELYEKNVDSLIFESVDESEITVEGVKQNDKIKKEFKDKIQTLKTDPQKKRDAIRTFLSSISEAVNSNVKYTMDPDIVSYKAVRKAASSFRINKRKKMAATVKKHGRITLESVEDKDLSLDAEVNKVCSILNNSKLSFEDNDISITTESQISMNVSKDARGSVIIPLSPDMVIPISVYGEHIGYYVIERVGSNDLGSGTSSLLGYKPVNSMYSLGMAGRMFAGGGGTTAVGSSGVILKDMTDLPMNTKDDCRRVELLQSMLTRAMSERLDNPDLVDDKAFNSIIYSLIKDRYITNREVRVTYVPAHMMVYFAHEINTETGVGESILKKGLFFAHIAIASLITNLMISISKSADREQVNVEVGVSGRIEQTVQKVMRTLQTKRASIDSINNVDTIMKSLGTFQRYISLRNNGTPIVELETIPGQQIDLDNSLQEKAIKSVINSFDIPHSALNFLDDAEYAKSVALQHGMFLLRVMKMQGPYQDNITKFARILLCNKYPDKILKSNSKPDDTNKGNLQSLMDINKVFVDLPVPNGLNVSSMNEQYQNVISLVDQIVDTLPIIGVKEEDIDTVKAALKLRLLRHHAPGMPWDEYVEMVEIAKKDVVSAKLLNNPDENSDNGSDPMDTSNDTDNSGDSGGGW